MEQRRRKLVLTGIAAALAGAIAAAITLTDPGPAYQATTEAVRYHTLPAPCGVLSYATIARYLPDPIVTDSFQRSDRDESDGNCSLESDSDRQDKSLLVQLTVYRPPHAVVTPWQETRSDVRVPGLGDQATVQFVAGHPGPEGAANIKPSVDIDMTVRSGNASFELTYLAIPIGSAPPAPSPMKQIALMTTIARDVLAALAHPALAVAPRPGPVVRYAVPANACTLVTKTVLARYFSGAVVFTGARLPAPRGTASCYWTASDGTSLNVDIDIVGIGDMTGQSQYEYDVQADGQGGTAATTVTTVNRIQPASGVGAEATVIFKTTTVPSLGWYATTHKAELLTWSGDAEIEITVTYDATDSNENPAPSPPSSATQIAALSAAAHQVLTGLPPQ